MWDECNCAVIWAFFGIAFLWDWNKSWPFPVLWPLLSFPNLLAHWVQHFHSIVRVMHHQHYAESIMRNAGLEEAQAGIKTAGRNVNNLRYADDTTLMAESEEELKSLLMNNARGKWKRWLKTQIQKRKIMASSPIISWQIDGETMETVRDFIFWELQNHCRWWLQPWN